MSNQVQSWRFSYHSTYDVKSISLPNGDQIPLPPRKMWTGGARVSVTQTQNEETKSYYVSITKDVYLESESDHAAGLVKDHGPGMVAKGLARKFATGLLGGVGGGLIGGIVGVLIPSDIATEKYWRTQTEDGAPITIIMIGFPKG